MALLYHSSAGKIYSRRLGCIFHHSDLIGKAELWFGGPVFFAMIALVAYTYTFMFGSFFLDKYPMETSTDADYACDPSLRNTLWTNMQQNTKSWDSK